MSRSPEIEGRSRSRLEQKTKCLVYIPGNYSMFVCDVEILLHTCRLMHTWIANMKFDCRFVFSRLPLRLQHRAVELAYENSLGDFLFPTSKTICSRTNPIIPLDQLTDIKYVKNNITVSFCSKVPALRFPMHQVSWVIDWGCCFSPRANSAMEVAKETKFGTKSLGCTYTKYLRQSYEDIVNDLGNCEI